MQCMTAAARLKEEGKIEHRLPDPTSFEQAYARDDWELWQNALNDEMDAMRNLGVYVEVDQSEVPSGTNIVKSKIVWKIKYKDTGAIEKYKCRLVACGWRKVDVYKRSGEDMEHLGKLTKADARHSSRRFHLRKCKTSSPQSYIKFIAKFRAASRKVTQHRRDI